MNLAQVFDRLAGVSLQTALLVAIVFGLTRWLPLAPRTRSLLWVIVFAHGILALFFAVPLPLGHSTIQPKFTVVSREVVNRTTMPLERSAPSTFDPKSVAVLGWAAGCLLTAFFLGRRELSARRLLQQSRPAGEEVLAQVEKVGQEMGITCVKVRLTDGSIPPCTAGFPFPTLYLPAGLDVHSDAFRALVIHELAHVRHGDLPAAIASTAARCLFFFHPLTWLAHREWSIQKEAACDAEVLHRSSLSLPAYCEVLIRCAQGRPIFSAVIQAATQGFSHLHRRICEMKNTQKNKKGAAPVATIAALAISALAAVPVTVTARKALTHSPEHATGSLPSIMSQAQTIEIGPKDSAVIRLAPDRQETDPLYQKTVSLSLADATLDSALRALASSARVKIEFAPTKVEGISMSLESDFRTTLDVLCGCGNLEWERTGEKSFKVFPSAKKEKEYPLGKTVVETLPSREARPSAPVEPVSAAAPEMLDPSHMLSKDKLLPSEAVAPVVAAEAVKVDETTVIVPSELNLKSDEVLMIDNFPTEPGEFVLVPYLDEKGKRQITFVRNEPSSPNHKN